MGQCRGRQRVPHRILGGLGKVGQPIEEPQCMQHSRIDAKTHAWIARLDTLQSRSGCEGALGNNCHRQTATSPCIVNIRAQLVQSRVDGRRWSMGVGMMLCS